jgi:hypothetical protein
VFATPKSLAAFPVATSLVATISRAARTICHADPDSVIVPLLSALAIGLAILIISVRDERARPRTRSDWLTVSSVAVINALVLFAAALGIEKF